MPIDFSLKKPDSMNIREFFRMQKSVNSGELKADSPVTGYAADQFDKALGGMFDDAQKKKLDKNGLSMFDVVYINGKSASEVYAKKYLDVTKEEREKLIKASIVSELFNNKGKVDVSPLVADKDGNDKMTPTSVKPSAAEAQPKRAWYEKLLFWRKTPDQKLQAEYDKPMPGKEKALNKSVLNNEGMVEVMKEPYMQMSKEFVTRIGRDRADLGRAVFGDDYKDPKDIGTVHPQIKQTESIRVQRSGVNIAIAMLFVDGHSFEDILDPNKLLAEKKAAGVRIKDMVARDDQKGAIELFKSFAEKYEQLPKLNIDHNNELDILANYREINCRGTVAFDIGQEFNSATNQKPAQKLIGKEIHDHLGDTLSWTSQLYSSIEESMTGYTTARFRDIADKRKSAGNTITGLHNRSVAADELNAAPQIKDINSIECGSKIFSNRFLVLDTHVLAGSQSLKDALKCIYKGQDCMVAGENGGLKVDFNKPVSPSLMTEREAFQKHGMSALKPPSTAPTSGSAPSQENPIREPFSFAPPEQPQRQVQQQQPQANPSLGQPEQVPQKKEPAAPGKFK